MNFSIENKDNLVIFTLKNTKLTSDISAQLKAKILIIAQSDIDALIMDLSTVEYCDSSGLGALLLANRQMSEFELPVVLCGVKEPVMQMLTISHIDSLFEFYPTVDEAVSDFSE